MNAETRACQNCKQQFAVDPEDFQFYGKVNVPPPTFCPDCRFERRLLFWNAINLYKRPCDLCKRFNVSVYAPDAPYTVYCPLCWWSDKWDPLTYGREYDFRRPFFEQLNELWHAAPLCGLSMDLPSARSSPYNHDAGYLKNCYFLFHADTCEDCAYGYFLGKCRMLFDCTAILQSEYGYDAMHSYKTNRCIGSRDQLSESLECLFCRDCQGCQNCFASANLKGQKYYAWNKPLSKQEYLAEIGKYDLGSYRVYRSLQEKAAEHWKTQIPKSEYNEFVKNCTGSNVFFSKNAKDCIEVSEVEDGRYCYRMFEPTNKDCYDISMWGNNLSLSYDSCVVGENSTQLRFTHESGLNLTDAEYCRLSTGGSHHFGCVSIKKGEYRIFNKVYSAKEYDELTKRIRKHMDDMPYTDARGNVYRYGEFFPPEMSPFAYNETLAQNFFPLTREQVAAKKYAWRDLEVKDMEATISAADLPDHTKDVTDGILKEIIKCATCSRSYRIIEMELAFLRQMNLPLPRRCPFCRINEKLNIWVKTNERNRRVCAECGAAMESKYREDEAPAVYCRKCYLQKIM
ncbi:MAG: hypothetical protein ABSE18_01885 [Minisyncoccia bacterium]|jgi:hypothetical protein